MHTVETLYEFDTSQAPESIGRNASDSIKPCPGVANHDEIRLQSTSLFTPIYSQLTIAVWVTGSQHWRARGSTSSISTSHYPESQGRRRDSLL